MNKKLYFYNNGDFDVRAMMTFGVSVKEKDDAIGFFGTGFKYAVAIILRLGGSIHIKTGDKTYSFESKKELIRGEYFDVVYMNGEMAGFTTRLGINWKPWQAYRELYCNATDENGDVSDSSIDADTVITVNCEEVYKAWGNRDAYFVSSKPLTTSGDVGLHQPRGSFIYYKGVAIFNTDMPSVFSYNIKSAIDLTEDRTAKHEFQVKFAIKRCLQNLKDKRLINLALTAEPDRLEARIGYDIDFGYSDEFVGVCRELLNKGISIPESARLMLKNIDHKAGDWPTFELTSVQKSMLNKSISFLENIDVDIERFPVITVDGLGDSVMGRAFDKKIYLSKIPFELGTKQVASTLLEEWVHNKHGCKDFDRQMQSWLFDKILSITEENVGEAL